MNKSNEIWHKRLVGIREELDCYLESHLPKEDIKFSASVVSSASEQPKRGGVMDKFLNYMKLNDEDDEYFDVDYLDDEESFSDVDENIATNKPTTRRKFQMPVIQPRPGTTQSPVVPQRPATHQSPKLTVPNAPIKVPDFLLERKQSFEIDKVLEQKAETFSSMLLE